MKVNLRGMEQNTRHQTRVPKETKENEGKEIMDNKFLELTNNNNDWILETWVLNRVNKNTATARHRVGKTAKYQTLRNA